MVLPTPTHSPSHESRGVRAYIAHVDATMIPADTDSVNLFTPAEGGVIVAFGIITGSAVNFDSGDTIYLGQGVGGGIPDITDNWLGLDPTDIEAGGALPTDSIALAPQGFISGGNNILAGLIPVQAGVPIAVSMANSGPDATLGFFDLFFLIASLS